MLDIDQIRRQIPALDKSIYMNTGGSGPMPRSAIDVIRDTYETAGTQGPDIPTVRGPIREQFEETRKTVARFFGVTPEEIALLRSVSEGLSTVAYGMDWSPGDEVIVTDEEHPSGIMIWLSLAEQKGIKVKKLRLVNDKTELLAGLDRLITGRTRLLCLSHVTTDTGTRLPAAEICSMAHDRGVPVAYDAAQSAGQFPIDLAAIDCDFYACTGHKWLLGGWGTGIFYVKREWVERLNISWTGSQAGTWDRDTDELQFADTAHRFEFGGRHDPLYNAMGNAIEFLDSTGLSEIEARVRVLTDRLKAGIAETSGVALRSPESPEFSTGIVTFSVNGLTGDDLNSQMWERWRVLGRAALKHSAMRLSTAFFTSDQEIDTVISAMGTLANENR
ncbi:MAG: aminotransferase class V-fold PLP-dependent enzyme [Chloroflexi bacterium]|nr:aminotransferase class V-fold PLP-dependent enzyme [Chloroflexota bacterium]